MQRMISTPGNSLPNSYKFPRSRIRNVFEPAGTFWILTQSGGHNHKITAIGILFKLPPFQMILDQLELKKASNHYESQKPARSASFQTYLYLLTFNTLFPCLFWIFPLFVVFYWVYLFLFIGVIFWTLQSCLPHAYYLQLCFYFAFVHFGCGYSTICFGELTLIWGLFNPEQWTSGFASTHSLFKVVTCTLLNLFLSYGGANCLTCELRKKLNIAKCPIDLLLVVGCLE